MLQLILAVGLGFQANEPDISKITAAQKKEFLELLSKLPTKGEFFTAEAIQKASPYLPTLFALNAKDVREEQYFALNALSRGLHDARKEHREFAVKHYGKIQHTMVKLTWGILLFRGDQASPEIVQYLRASLDDRERAELLDVLLGPEFEKFKAKVIEKAKSK
jgi:hypothetical protein